MQTKQLESFPPNSNPFHHDAYHMGYRVGTNCYIMFENHDTSECRYLIVINTVTGERTKVIVTTPVSTITENIVNIINADTIEQVKYIPHSLIKSISIVNDEETFVCIFCEGVCYKSNKQFTTDANGITGDFTKL